MLTIASDALWISLCRERKNPESAFILSCYTKTRNLNQFTLRLVLHWFAWGWWRLALKPCLVCVSTQVQPPMEGDLYPAYPRHKQQRAIVLHSWMPPTVGRSPGVMLSYARLSASYRLFIRLVPWGVSFSFLIFKSVRAGIQNSSGERPLEWQRRENRLVVIYLVVCCVLENVLCLSDVLLFFFWVLWTPVSPFLYGIKWD